MQWQEVLTQTHMISSIYGDMTMYQGLSNSRTDGYGALAQRSAVAILNAYSHPVKYTFIPIQVRLKFRNALVTEQSVFHTAREFETANTALSQEYLETYGDCSSHGQASILLNLLCCRMRYRSFYLRFTDSPLFTYRSCTFQFGSCKRVERLRGL